MSEIKYTMVIEQLQKELSDALREIERLIAENEKWQARVAELEEALTKINEQGQHNRSDGYNSYSVSYSQTLMAREALANKSDWLQQHDEPLLLRIKELENHNNFDAVRLQRLATYCGVSIPESAEAQLQAAGVIVGTCLRVLQRDPNYFIATCPDKCGCLWRNNCDGTMSLYGKNSKSCDVCEKLPWSGLVPLVTPRNGAESELHKSDWEPVNLEMNTIPLPRV